MDDEQETRYERKLRRLFAVYAPYHSHVVADDPISAAAFLRRLADEAPDDDHLAVLSVELVEAFLGVQGEAAYPSFEEALRASKNLRKAWSCAWSVVPDEWESRFDALLRPGEVIDRT